MSRAWLITGTLTLVLILPVYYAGQALGWSSAVAGWWSLAVIGAMTILQAELSEREAHSRSKRRSRRRRSS